ncbi:hypothetical protein D9615_000765 [Tricholomella constricta]|uniref:EVE domain-containing protein n=1 Tax=Tricholomella constricta TaxID=117010 RepID=A0A8H5MBZ4_9AGAR|nr:hypothetical protein D9615_000765 [Tricholomella constricta]
MAPGKYWLLKAEPDTRVVKGKDVKFSVDDFESIKTSPWEGVRNYEARNLMKQMQIGEKALFYHSNCKNPGIAAFAEVSKEAYPDCAYGMGCVNTFNNIVGALVDFMPVFSRSHPYYDVKTKQEDPRWFMVNLTFVSRASHFVPLALLRLISESTVIPSEIEYIGEVGFKALQSMDLVKKGRLSVQRVEETAWNAIVALAEEGGWEDMDLKVKKKKSPSKAGPVKLKKKVGNKRAKEEEEEEKEVISEDCDHQEEEEDSAAEGAKTKGGRKRKAKDEDNEDYSVAPRRSTRRKR